MSVGSHDPSRDYCDLRERRVLSREVIRRIPGLSEAQWRDYCGVYLGLPIDEYATIGDVPRMTILHRVETAREKILNFLQQVIPNTQARDFLSVEVEGKSAGEQAANRGVGRSAVYSNIRGAKDRLPDLVGYLEGSE